MVTAPGQRAIGMTSGRPAQRSANCEPALLEARLLFLGSGGGVTQQRGSAWCLITGVSVLSERWNDLDCRIFCVLVYFCHIALAIKVLTTEGLIATALSSSGNLSLRQAELAISRSRIIQEQQLAEAWRCMQTLPVMCFCSPYLSNPVFKASVCYSQLAVALPPSR